MQHRTANTGPQRVFIGSPQIYGPTTNTAGVETHRTVAGALTQAVSLPIGETAKDRRCSN
jgi:hypothetical protein